MADRTINMVLAMALTLSMSSAEESDAPDRRRKKGTKDTGDGWTGIWCRQAMDEDLVQGYKTSYWDSVPDQRQKAKTENG